MNTLIPMVVDTERAAALLGLSTSTLAKLRLTGDGPPFIKLGRRVVYRLSDLEKWLDGRCFASTSQYGREPS
jgi:predicted DNA-binding transcriptional regulator AlpA